MNIREAIERSWRTGHWAYDGCYSFYWSTHVRFTDICLFVPRFLKAIISQKQGEKQQITEYNWENKVYESGVWMNSK